MKYLANYFYLILFNFCSSGNIQVTNKQSTCEKDIKLYQHYRQIAQQISKEIRDAFKDLQTTYEKTNKTSWCLVPEPKSLTSVERKIKVRNVTIDKITDFARGAFIVSSEAEVQYVRNFFLKKFGTPIREKDNFSKPTSTGYTDYNLVFENTKLKMPFEIQIHICNNMLVKNIGHIFYEIIDSIETHNKLHQNNAYDIFIKLKEPLYYLILDGCKLNPIEFDKVYKSFKIWNSDMSNLTYYKHFANKITNFINRLYGAISKDYKSNNSKCNIKGINNKNCSVDEKVIREEGFKYIRSIWK
jgi:hypothetical protein